jgi:hypothetical protein
MFGLEGCKAGVKIQLVPSWGCSLQTGKGGDAGNANHCLPNTIAFNVDGARGDSQLGDHTLKECTAVTFSCAVEQNIHTSPGQGE